MIERRKNIRISHEARVQFISSNRSYQGKLTDISRGGMKIVTDIPESPQTIEKVIFALPKSDKPLQIPCKLVRKEKRRIAEKKHILGIEFAFEAEAEMCFIESFIKEISLAKLNTQEKNADMRHIPRTACVIKKVTCDKEGIHVLSIDNISIDGLSISYQGTGLHHRDNITLKFRLPDDNRVLSLSGTIRYTKKNVFDDSFTAGILFDAINDLDRIRIKNFISSYTVATAMQVLHEKFCDAGIDERYKIHNPARIHSIFSELVKEQIHINVLFEENYKLLELPITNYDLNNRMFSLDERACQSYVHLKKNHKAYFSFSLQSGTYYFKANLTKRLEGHTFFSLPATIYQSEKRSYQRNLAGEDIVFTNVPADGLKRSLQGKIINISRRGFMCELPLGKENKEFFRLGRIVEYQTDEKLELGTYGEVRHALEKSAPTGLKILQLGIEAGIGHKPFRFARYTQKKWEKLNLHQEDLPLSAREKINSLLVKYQNKKGQKITALVNLTHKKITAPVIILPPAFGKKKETLSPLASTLITNARCFGKEAVIIRYDGINRPGESYNQEMVPKRGYEMLYYRISQGRDDLQATLDYVFDNPLFKPSRVIVIAFSMSAMDVRKLASQSNDHRIDCIINVMGVSCGQSAFRNMTGGLDIIGFYMLGIRSGLFGILGHILDLDNLAEDLIDQRYAYMTDARLDMSKISTPILWVYGKYDKWIDENEVKDLMEIESGGSREVIEIPTGHNIRSSEDAIKTFKIITSWIHEKLYNEKIIPCDPDRDILVNLIAYERDRIASSEEFNIEEYWKEYLIGKSKNSFGYDFYKNIKEFRDFLTFQSKLIDMQDNERIVDMGCGTGLLVENMLNLAVDQQKDIRNARLIMVDLIKEALDKTKTKVKKIQKLNRALLPQNMSYIVRDLEPNRLIPVHKFINDIDLDLNFMRNRIDGFTNTIIDRLINKSSKRLYEILKGTNITRGDEDYIESEFDEEDGQIIVEFNRAARFLKRKLKEEDFVESDLKRMASSDSIKYYQLSTSDLEFSKLNFGHNGLRLHLNFKKNYFDKIIASLFISYLFNPDEIFYDFYRMLRPNGLLLVSSMKPDSDISLIFSNYIDKIQHFDFRDSDFKSQDKSLLGAREMLNEAAALFELEEDGYFKFFSDKELADMFKAAGFSHVQVYSSMGNPPQAFIVTGRKS